MSKNREGKNGETIKTNIKTRLKNKENEQIACGWSEKHYPI
jgi:hypothetical protein